MMSIEKCRVLRGPNRWTRRTAVELTLVVDEVFEPDATAMSALMNRLAQRFPDLGRVFADDMSWPSAPLALGKIWERTLLSLQLKIGTRVTFSLTQPIVDSHGRPTRLVHVVVEYSEEAVIRALIDLAERLITTAWRDEPCEIEQALADAQELDEDIRLGPSTLSIVEAAQRRSIPYRRLTTGSMVQFGWGRQQRRILAAETDQTSAIAESIAQDKDLTKSLLHAAGVPVPEGVVVTTEEEALAAAKAIGAPDVAVVLKPRDGNQGKGVAVNMTTPAQIKAAFAVAAAISDEVIVERSLRGADFRVLVIGGQVIAAARRDPPQVIGDGVHSIRELIEQVNRDPRRGEGHATSLTKIRLDALALATLEKQQLTPESVPSKGQVVVLRNNANLSTGGTATDVTDDIHPGLAASARMAAQMIGLDICGVDMVCETITRPLEEQGGGIVEVNAAPGLRMHLAPSFGKTRPVGEAIIQSMFSPGEDARIPLISVTGTNGKTTTVRLIAHIMSQFDLTVGMTNSDGVYIKGVRVDTGDCSGPRSARSVLMNPDVDCAVLETARGGVLREGLGFDRADVAVVTNLGQGDHLGIDHIHTLAQLAQVKGVIVDNVASHGFAVLNATDPAVAAMASRCPGQIIFFSDDHHHPVLSAHRAKGLRCVYREGDAVVIWHGGLVACLSLADIPLTDAGRLPFQVENVMAAVAGVWGLSLTSVQHGQRALAFDWARLVAGLASFHSDHQTVPGRFNRFQYRGAQVIADYGHNPDAMLALVKAVEALGGRRRVAVISGAGDRRDEDLREQTRILGDSFDTVVLYEDQCQRGRQDGEVVALLKQGLQTAKRCQRVETLVGEFRAIDLALSSLAPDDVCLVFVDQVDEAVAYLGRVCQGGNGLTI